MKCYAQNQGLLDRVWRRIEQRWRGYPAPLRRAAVELTRTLGPSPRRFFSGPDAGPLLHFPIWLAGKEHRRDLPDLLEGIALAYLFVRIQDNVIDEPATRGRPPWLLLGNVLLGDAVTLLAGFAGGSRSFWRRARAAWALFASETASEHRQLARRTAYRGAAFRRHARKVALARVPLYALLARMGRDDARHVAMVDRLIDQMGEAYGLANDVLGCPRDLACGAETYLIASARSLLPRRLRNDTRAVRQVLIAEPLFERFLRRAVRIHLRARETGRALGMRAMDAFTADRVARLEHHIREATTLRLAVALARAQSAQ